MKGIILPSIAFLKGFVLFLRPHAFLGWMRHLSFTFSNTLSLSKWISQQDKNGSFNDFYTPKRNYAKRLLLFQHLIETQGLKEEAFDYLEFGVFNGNSFKWWVKHCTNPNSHFYGFDTFEGLPENWGTFNKGEMASTIPVIDDQRVRFIKGLFQDTLFDFFDSVNLKNGKRKIIHLDADLFSSTLFILTSMAPYLKKGDILLFDEFNVPNHEYLAFKVFSESFYVKTKLLAAVNNYYQIALIIE